MALRSQQRRCLSEHLACSGNDRHARLPGQLQRPLQTRDCGRQEISPSRTLLGINDSYGVKDCNEKRLKYAWTLSCDGGKVKYSGTSDKILGGAYANDWMETEFGGFEAKRWERCHLQINFVDGSPLLSDTNPKLRVFTELF